MSKKIKPLLSDIFLDELANEINQIYGEPREEKEDEKSDEKEN